MTTEVWEHAVAAGIVSREELEEARIVRGLRGSKVPIGEILLEEGVVTPERMEEAKAAWRARFPEDVRAALEDPKSRIDRFVRLRMLGRGGLGEVWLAFDLKLSRRVALKFPRPEHRERFLGEARTLATLDHPSIVPILEIGPGYLVMPVVEGEPLDRLDLSAREAAQAVAQAARAMETAHARGVVHGDLKPANLLARRERGGVRVVVVDFGVSRRVGESDPETLAGTPEFMAPEVFRGAAADAKADVYALGATLAALVKGKAVPGRIARVVARAVERDPARRTADAGRLARELEGSKPLRRVAAGLVLLAALAGLAGYEAGRAESPQAQRARELAEAHALVERGFQQWDAGRKREAVEDFLAAHRKSRGGAGLRRMVLSFLLQSGDRHGEAGKWASALDDYLAAYLLAPSDGEVLSRVEEARDRVAEGTRP